MRQRSALSLALIGILSLTACSKKQEAVYAVQEVPLTQISADLAAAKTTSVAVTKAYIARIKANDSALHAIIAIAPDAVEQAAASDKRRKEGRSLGPLDGVPLLFKDNIDAVGMPTTAGSFALANNLPAQDSEVVKRLRAAGVVILGKTNLSQFAGFRTTDAFNSSTVGGGAFNPYNTANSTCGSSSGSGVAAAVSFAAAAIGTETDGSVVCPSSTNGLVGIKPTIALVSRRGIVPISHTQDSSGPMARSVADAAMLLTVMAGTDPADPQSTDADAHKADYVKGLDAASLKGARLGVLRGTQGSSDKTDPVYEAALAVLKAQGAELVEIPREQLEDLSQEQLTVLYYDFKQDLAAYLATTSPDKVKVRTLADLMEFDKIDEHEKLHGQDVFESAEATTNFDAQEYKDARASGLRKATIDGIDKWLAENNITAVLALTNAPGGPVRPDGVKPAHGVTMREGKGDKPPHATTYASVAGYPNLTVPMGLVEGMPVGLTFIGPAWSEQRLLSYGYAYEQASHARVAPPPFQPAAK